MNICQNAIIIFHLHYSLLTIFYFVLILDLTSPVKSNGHISESSGQARMKQRASETVRQSQRASARQNESANFRDISLKRFNTFVHIIFNPATTKMKNAFNSRVLFHFFAFLVLEIYMK